MARTIRSRGLLAFLVLNLLAERPMHPYEMKRLIRWRGKDRLPGINRDSLYHAIAQLKRAALIEPVETSREGRRPERTVYRVTEGGQDELHAWMEELLSEPTNELPRFIAALAHLAAVDPATCRRLLERRALALEMEVASLEAGVRGSEGSLPRVFLLEGEFAHAVKRAELDWVRALIDDLATGRLAWSREELLRFAAQEPGAVDGTA
jgi:DNA-binding PadR family transcriptional regulator